VFEPGPGSLSLPNRGYHGFLSANVGYLLSLICLPSEEYDKNLMVVWTRVSQGDPIAFSLLFRESWPSVYGTCLHFCKNAEISKDLAQEIFAKIWTRRQQLGEVEKPAAFLHTIARNTILDHFRSLSARPGSPYLLNDCSDPSNSDPLQKLERKELATHLARAIQQLPPKLRAVFTLSREGKTHNEIAKIKQISVMTSKTYVVRALAMLRKKLER
jgi:RNA polymerase sigma factor (sigma-70 family)